MSTLGNMAKSAGKMIDPFGFFSGKAGENLSKLNDELNGNAGTDRLNEKQNQRQEETYNRERLFDFRLAQLAERNSAANQKAGLAQAGFTPVLDGGVSPAGGSAGSTAQPTGGNSHGKGYLDTALSIANLNQLQANTENIEANTKKTEQEEQNLKAEHQNITNKSNLGDMEVDARRQYNQVFASALKRDYPKVYEKMKVDAIALGYASDDETFFESLTSGSFEGLQQYQHIVAEIARDSVDEFVHEKMLKDPEVISALAHMPKLDRAKMKAEITQLGIMASDLQYDLQIKQRYASRFKESELTNLETEIAEKRQQMEESKKRIDKMSSEKFKNYADGASAITKAVTGVMSLVP